VSTPTRRKHCRTDVRLVRSTSEACTVAMIAQQLRCCAVLGMRTSKDVNCATPDGCRDVDRYQLNSTAYTAVSSWSYLVGVGAVVLWVLRHVLMQRRLLLQHGRGGLIVHIGEQVGQRRLGLALSLAPNKSSLATPSTRRHTMRRPVRTANIACRTALRSDLRNSLSCSSSHHPLASMKARNRGTGDASVRQCSTSSTLR